MRILFALSTFFLSLSLMFSEGLEGNVLLQSIHCCIALICSISLFLYNRFPFSLYQIVHLFILAFLCIAPILQYKNGITIWGGIPFSEADYILTSLYVLGVLLLYNGIYAFVIHRKVVKAFVNIASFFSNETLSMRLSRKEESLFIVVMCVILGLLLKINDYNIYSLFYRGGELVIDSQLTMSNNYSTGQVLVVSIFLRPMAVVLFLAAFRLGVSHKFVLFLLGILMFLCAFPTAMARFSFAALYLLILLTLSRFIRKDNVLILVLVFGLLFVFPYLSRFRNYNDNMSLDFSWSTEMFLGGDFDSYSSFLRVINHDIITYGYQLLGSLFFWIPRSIWSSKPIGSGSLLHETLHLDFDNISCCYFAEGYINAGILGVFLFVMILAVLTGTLDKGYWTIVTRYRNSYFDLIYYICFGLLFFLLRGDLLSSFAYMIGFVLSCVVVYILLRTQRRYRLKL